MRLPYNSFEASRERITSMEPSIQYEEVINLLQSRVVANHIEAGNLTVAMIRPGLNTSTVLLEGDDFYLADKIEENIANLGILAKFSMVFDEEAFDNFYAGQPKDVQLRLPPVRGREHETRWDEFEALMTGGVTTVLLLYSPAGDAIDKWRSQVGHWNIVDKRDLDTIRGKFGVDNYNNLIHGSDAPQSALREVSIIAECLKRKFQIL